jgi:hypothetical protein
MAPRLPKKAKPAKAEGAKLWILAVSTQQREDCQTAEKVNSAKVEGAKLWA